MKSKLGFSIATIANPDILILDEVLSVGDAKFRKKSEAKIMQLMLFFERADLEAWLRQNPIKTQAQIEQEAQKYILSNRLLKK